VAERASEDGILGLLPCIRLGAAAAKRATSAVAARRAVDASCGMATVTEMSEVPNLIRAGLRQRAHDQLRARLHVRGAG